MITESDARQITDRGASVADIELQFERFKKGFPFLRLAGSAKIGAGIHHLSPEQETSALRRWNEYLADGGKVTKFVPASGAASRMFKSLFAFVDGPDEKPKPGSDVAEILKNIHKLAFYPELNDTVKKLYGKDVDSLLSEGRDKDVIAAIVKEEGMNYGNLPKGLLTFHAYDDDARTPLEEQLVEGAQSAKSSDGLVHLHFTVSAHHRKLFEKKLEKVVPRVEKKMGVKFDISLSEQKPSTETVAVNDDNTPFREDGKLVFRPGGHGTLIGNLNDIDSEVVFIKNIDNVVPDALREPTLRYKRILGGVLVETHDHIADFLKALENPGVSDAKLREIVSFLHTDLFIRFEEPSSREHLIEFLKKKLNRPLRVCGMVRNEGEPGGGPFIAYNSDGTASPQILESSQIDPSNEEYLAMMASATHFNPVDLVCYIKDPDGHGYNLLDHVDPDTGFISSKSLHGKSLKALELPGLWNGAMSDWNTIFVEVPSATFNPVKTVNDLLRPAHQG